ncbi:hypothetical protein [Sporosalibacterium faouarense]|uniref:hypothetical protein n=1 Tax=Sporosalibacterium faouarense TaxID=516123 RepID=UPI00192A93DA|nr:hypothetical protein [Sporosalibacterium faouarense]
MGYKKVSFFIIFLLIFLTSCTKSTSKEVLNSNVWMDIENKEWSNFDTWAGKGIYFYENDNKPMGVYMIYGSGVPIAFLHESVVEIIDNEINIEMPIFNEKQDTYEIINTKLNYEDGKLMMNDKIYKSRFNKDIMEMIKEYKESE